MLRPCWLGLDLGGTKLLGVVVDEHGAVLAKGRRPTGRAFGPEQAVGAAVDLAGHLVPSGTALMGVGLGFPGLVDGGRGVVRSSVMLDGWQEIELGAALCRALGVPCTVDNDVNCAALGEMAVGDHSGLLVFAAVGTGIGGALALDGRLLRGATGVSGELGNMSIDRDGPSDWTGRCGTLNALASGTALLQATGLQGDALSAAFIRDEPGVVEHVYAAADALGEGLANVLYLLNPDRVVLGGGVALLGERWLERVVTTARAHAFHEAALGCQFSLARTGYMAGALGAAALARGHDQHAARRQ